MRFRGRSHTVSTISPHLDRESKISLSPESGRVVGCIGDASAGLARLRTGQIRSTSSSAHPCCGAASSYASEQRAKPIGRDVIHDHHKELRRLFQRQKMHQLTFSLRILSESVRV